MNSSGLCFLSALACALAAGCGTSGDVRKIEHFAEYPSGAGGVPNYYRLTLAGRGQNGQFDYRSGWYDARAVDSLFGAIGQAHGAHAVTELRQRAAVERTYDAYMTALEQGAADAPAKKTAYEAVLQSVGGMTERLGDAGGPLDHAGEKFIMVLSNDPSKIIDAIKQHVQQIDVAGTVGEIVEHRRAGESARAKRGAATSAAELRRVRDVIAQASKDLPSQPANVSDLQSLLDQWIAETGDGR